MLSGARNDIDKQTTNKQLECLLTDIDITSQNMLKLKSVLITMREAYPNPV